MPSSGRLRAASMNLLRLLAELLHVSEPLRSCSRKLKPDEAPKPEMVGMLNGKMIASGIAATCALQPAHDAVARAAPRPCARPTASSARRSCRSSAGRCWSPPRSRRWSGNESTPSVLARISSTFFSTALVRSSDAAGRELDVDAEDALVLVRDEAGRQRAAEEAGADGHRRDDARWSATNAARAGATRSRSRSS